MCLFQEYAKYYNDLYRDKDYAAECSFLADVFATYSPDPVKTVLDLGCATGGHALLLAERGLEVTGLGLSEQMLAEAQHRAQNSNLNKITFRQADIRNFDLGSRLDAVIAMFAVVGYQITE